MRVDQFDLNLLKVFNAIFEERNLVSAGRRLHLTQSAVSHALTRLREAVGDELFVRTSKGMVPTASAIRMAPTLRDALLRIEATLDVEAFEPSVSCRKFTIAANDHLTEVLVAALLRLLQVAAPSVDLVVRPSTRLDLAEQIDHGRIDLALGTFSQVPSRMSACALLKQGEAIVMRKGHPAGGQKLTLEEFLRHPLLTISVGGHEEGAVDGFIMERGLARQSEMFNSSALDTAAGMINSKPHVRLTVPHSLAIPALLHDTDMLSIVPTSLATALVARDKGLQMRVPPYEVQFATTSAVWHSRSDHDSAQVWLRDMVIQAAKSLERKTPWLHREL